MSYTVLPERSAALRYELSIADAVHQRGLLAVLGAAVSAWWHRPRLPSNIPPYLRDDVGLLPDATPAYWIDITPNPVVPNALRRPGV